MLVTGAIEIGYFESVNGGSDYAALDDPMSRLDTARMCMKGDCEVDCHYTAFCFGIPFGHRGSRVIWMLRSPKVSRTLIPQDL